MRIARVLVLACAAVVLGNVWINSSYLAQTTPADATNRKENKWDTQRFFHNLGKRIEGSLPIQFYGKRKGYFNFNNALLWKRVNQDEYESYQHCDYCASSNGECRQGKLTVFKPSGDVKGPLSAPAVRMINQRAYTANVTTFHPKFRPIYIRCEFTQPLSVDKEGGRLYLDQHRKLHVLVNPQTSINAREDVVCGRGIYGHRTEAESIKRFARYYLERWKFHRIILYSIGLNDFAHAKELSQLIADGKLVILDFTSEYERLYGDHSRDLMLFSNNFFQLDLKFDCITRAKAMHARWTFHVDIDEYLFESQPSSLLLSPLTSFNDYAESKFGNLTHLSFAIQTINHTTPTRLCECNPHAGEFDLDLFVKEENEKHAIELALHRNKLPGPFHHTNGHMSAQRGKRKLLIRVDKLEVNPWHIGIHIARHCSVMDQQHCMGNNVGRNVDPLREMYLREFACSNVEICKPELDVDWWK